MPQTGIFGVVVTNGVLSLLQDDTAGGVGGSNGLILVFQSASVSQAGPEIYSGVVFIRTASDILTPLQVAMITRMLDPYNGKFAISAAGTLSVDPSGSPATLEVTEFTEVAIAAGPTSESSRIPAFLRQR
jgi:hypothetical protein